MAENFQQCSGKKKIGVNDFLSKRGVRVWMGMDGRGSFVDTNIISNQASHPPTPFIGRKRENYLYKYIFSSVFVSVFLSVFSSVFASVFVLVKHAC